MSEWFSSAPEVRVTDRRWRENGPVGDVKVRRVKPQPRLLDRAAMVRNIRTFA